jgi:hypothetical protein
MMRRISALTDYPKGVVLHDGSTADSSQETLLHPTIETENRDFRRWNFNHHRDFSEGNPRNEDTEPLVTLIKQP